MQVEQVELIERFLSQLTGRNLLFLQGTLDLLDLEETHAGREGFRPVEL